MAAPWVAAYVAVGLAAVVAQRFGGLAPWHPPLAVGLALMARRGMRLWPSVLGANVIISVALQPGDPLTALLVAGSATVECVVGGALLHRATRGRLVSGRDLALTIVVAGGVVPLVGATVGAFVLSARMADGTATIDHWTTWWVGDAAAALALLPVLLTTGRVFQGRSPWALRALEAIAVLCVQGAIVWWAFGGSASQRGLDAGAMLAFLPVSWVAVRYGARTTSVVVALTGLAAMAAFVFRDESVVGNDALLASVRVFLLVISVVAMGLAVAFDAERRSSARLKAVINELDHSQVELLQSQRVAGVGSWTLLPRTGTLSGSSEFARLFGLHEPVSKEQWLASLPVRERARVDAWLGTIDANGTGELEIELDQPLSLVVTLRAALFDGRRIAGTAQDVTEARRLTEQFVRNEKLEAVGRLAAGTAHDFNNMLHVINGVTELLASDNRLDPSLTPMVGQLKRAGLRASEVVGRLNAFNRTETYVETEIDLNAVVAEAAELIDWLIGSDVSLEVSLCDGDPAVLIDRARFQQAVVNLAANARDAMPRGGLLRIATEAEVRADGVRSVVLEVTDSGEGMDEGTLQRVFEPFFTTKARGQGTGLGLPGVQATVERAGGSVSVSSTPGEGTTVAIHLPVVVPVPAPPTVPSPPPVPLPLAGTVLLVEDDTAVRMVAEQWLGRLGYFVLACADAELALAQIADPDRSIDLLITDVALAGISGTELADHVALLRPGVPVLFATGSPGHPDDLRLGPSRFLLPKPYSGADLAGAVASAVGVDATA